MIRSTILVPVADNAGKPFADTDWRAFELRALDVAGGWTRLTNSEGMWRDGNVVYHDRTRHYAIDLESWRQVTAFLELADWVCVHFRQLAVLVTIAGVPEILALVPP